MTTQIADLSTHVIDAFTAVGVYAEIVPMGGGCEAIRVSYQRPDGAYLHIGNGDTSTPDTLRVCAAWIDEDNGTETPAYDTAELAYFDLADILASLVAEVVA